MSRSHIIDELLGQYPLISDQVSKNEVAIILQCLDQTITNTKSGDIVEFGCYAGTTSLFLQRFLTATGSDREFHVYDSFVGLPEKTKHDVSPAGEQFIKGELSYSKKDFISNFRKAGVPLPTIHKGWFSELSTDDIPQNIAFAFLDGDYYDSIWQSLRLVENQLVNGAVVIIDDYQSEALPGARKATDEWLKTHPSYSIRVSHSLGIITQK